MKILLIHGPNLNLLGRREPEVYGNETLPQINARLQKLAKRLDVVLTDFQSNHEGKLIDRLHTCMDDGTDCVIINPGALTHTSIALRDALLAINIPFVEVHLSNVFAREKFRGNSFLSGVASGVISGFGVLGYEFALRAATSLGDS